MNYLDPNLVDLGAESQDEAQVSIAVLERRLEQLLQQLGAADYADPALRARLQLEAARVETELDQPTLAWGHAICATDAQPVDDVFALAKRLGRGTRLGRGKRPDV